MAPDPSDILDAVETHWAQGVVPSHLVMTRRYHRSLETAARFLALEHEAAGRGEELARFKPWLAQMLVSRCADQSLEIPYGEAYIVVPDTDLGGVTSPFKQMEQRFHRSLRQQGHDKRSACVVTASLAEIVSNAQEHACTSTPTLAGYQIAEKGWLFVVSDIGIGVRRSLQRNPDYASVMEDEAALHLAVKEGVTSTGERGRGTGLAELMQLLVSSGSQIALSSGIARVEWEGELGAECLTTRTKAVSVGGLRVTARGLNPGGGRMATPV